MSEHEVTKLRVEPPTIIGMARPDIGYCQKQDGYAVVRGATPHPKKGYRLPNRQPWPDGVLARGDGLQAGDFLCTECYREEFHRLHGYDPFWGPEDLRSARKNKRDKNRKAGSDDG